MADSFEHPGIFGHMDGLDDFDFWHSRRRQRQLRLMEEDWDEGFYWDSHPRFGIGNSEMDISDSILLEMAQQQKSLQETLSRATKQMNRMETNLLDENDHNSEDGNMEPHMVVNDLLPLVRDIVEFGKRCDELQETATRLQEKGVPASAAGAMQSLSFEIVAAVARIVTSISESGARRPFASTSSTIMVAQTVHLIRTVRIPRIAKLAEAAAQHLSHGEAAQSTRNDAVLESGPAVPTDGDCDGQQRELQLEVAAAIDNLPGLVQDKVTSIIDQFQDDMCKRMEREYCGGSSSAPAEGPAAGERGGFATRRRYSLETRLEFWGERVTADADSDRLAIPVQSGDNCTGDCLAGEHHLVAVREERKCGSLKVSFDNRLGVLKTVSR